MTIRTLGDGSAASGVMEEETPPGQAPHFMPQPAQQSSSVMPVGPDVDVASVLGPLIDGSFSQAQGQAAVMAGVRLPQAGGSTMPMKSTAPLPGGTGPLRGGAPPPRSVARVPHQLVQSMV